MIRKDETIFAASVKDFDSRELRLRAYLQVSVLASRYDAGSGRPEPNAVGVKGNRDTTTNRNEPDHDRICRHKRPYTQ